MLSDGDVHRVRDSFDGLHNQLVVQTTQLAQPDLCGWGASCKRRFQLFSMKTVSIKERIATRSVLNGSKVDFCAPFFKIQVNLRAITDQASMLSHNLLDLLHLCVLRQARDAQVGGGIPPGRASPQHVYLLLQPAEVHSEDGVVPLAREPGLGHQLVHVLHR